jgi:3-dehydroquinate dehydratase II
MPSVVVLNGPNLNLLGVRRPEIYGTTTLAQVEELCRQEADRLGLDTEFRQSNHEGQLIDWIQQAGVDHRDGSCLGAVFNPGGFTHTSVALHDAVEGTRLPVIEVHISQLHQREDFRHHSYISQAPGVSSSDSAFTSTPSASRRCTASPGTPAPDRDGGPCRQRQDYVRGVNLMRVSGG